MCITYAITFSKTYWSNFEVRKILFLIFFTKEKKRARNIGVRSQEDLRDNLLNDYGESKTEIEMVYKTEFQNSSNQTLDISIHIYQWFPNEWVSN